jgi:hypothetical protein
LANSVLPADRIAKVIDAAERIDQVDDAGTLVPLLVR